MPRLLNDDIVKQVSELFADLKEPVALIFFGDKNGRCDYCDDTRQLLEEVVAISDLLSLETYDLQENADIAARYHVDKAPGIVVAAKNGDEIVDYGIRYAGIPSGHEFTSIINDILTVGRRDSGLSEETRAFLRSLDKPVLLQVFVTPTCPYCPRAVVLAHQMALESPLVQAEMIESMEFPELADRYSVSGVPHTVINDGKGNVIGAVPESHLVEEMKRALAG
jgi:glutaredoxin-like protein